MNTQEQLNEYFSKFPGVGRRQARRFVDFLLKKNTSYTSTLADLIRDVKRNMRQCTESYQYFYDENAAVTLSPIARDTSRDRSILMIVEKDIDIESIEKSGAYHGVYFVLGSLIPVTTKEYQKAVRIDELLERIQKGVEQDELREIIFGLSLNPESENTRVTLEQKLQPLKEKYNLKLSRLGRGLSTGTELEYSDKETIEHALERRVS